MIPTTNRYIQMIHTNRHRRWNREDWYRNTTEKTNNYKGQYYGHKSNPDEQFESVDDEQKPQRGRYPDRVI